MAYSLVYVWIVICLSFHTLLSFANIADAFPILCRSLYLFGMIQQQILNSSGVYLFQFLLSYSYVHLCIAFSDGHYYFGLFCIDLQSHYHKLRFIQYTTK